MCFPRRIAVLCLALSMVSVGSGREFDVYLFAGQSNMDGRGKSSVLTKTQRRASDDVIIFYRNPPHTSDGWKPLEPGYSIAPKYKGGLPSQTFGPEIGFASTIRKARPERNFAFIKGSKGGTSLRADWNPGTKDNPESQGPCYRNFIETVNLAISALKKEGHSAKLQGLLWHQGESDSKTSTKVHQQRLIEFVARIREDLAEPDLLVVVGEVFDNGKRDNVRAALRGLSESDPACALVSSAGMTTWDAGTHFDAKSQLLLGQRYADAVLNLTDAGE